MRENQDTNLRRKNKKILKLKETSSTLRISCIESEAGAKESIEDAISESKWKIKQRKKKSKTVICENWGWGLNREKNGEWSNGMNWYNLKNIKKPLHLRWDRGRPGHGPVNRNLRLWGQLWSPPVDCQFSWISIQFLIYKINHFIKLGHLKIQLKVNEFGWWLQGVKRKEVTKVKTVTL